jgi:hypothetical protein
VRLDFRSEEVMWHSYRHPVTVRHGYRHGRMTGVISSQGVVFRVPVDYTRSRPSRRWSELRVGGPRGSPPC